MKEFDVILDECVEQIQCGASTIDECVVRHPEHAAQLRPLLQAVVKAQAGRAVVPSPAFRAQTRARLNEHMRVHPRKQPFPLPVWRMTLALTALLVLFLGTGTVFAQGALPGDGLYAWKLQSEMVWRAASINKLNTDLAISNRRVNEMVAVSDDELRVIGALEEYKNLIARFQTENDEANRQKILPVLQAQRDTLAHAGLLVPELDNYFMSDSQVGDGLPSPSTEPTPLAPTLLPAPPPH